MARLPARLLVLWLPLATPAAAAATAGIELILDVETPAPGAVLDPDDALLYVSGSAFEQHGDRVRRADVVFVIDVSGSTAAAAGADIDGDGSIGRSRRSKPAHPDSILGAETAAVAALIDQFNPHTTRVGIVAFSGEGRANDAWVERPLTRDYAEVRSALEDIRALGAQGGTNMQAGLDTGARALVGTRLATGRAKILVFLTDGKPTLPSRFEPRNAELAIEAAHRAGRRGIRIYSYAIGPEANESPEVMRAAAEATGGRFVAVREPGELRTMLEQVQWVDLETLEVRNATTGGAVPVAARPDGSFGALIAVRPGENALEVYGRTTDGVERSRRFTVTVAPGAPRPTLTESQRVARALLVERRRVETERARRDLERELEIEPED